MLEDGAEQEHAMYKPGGTIRDAIRRVEQGRAAYRGSLMWGWEDSNFKPNGYCRDTSEPGLAALIYRRSGRGST
jgi:hypothetical protein